MVITLLIKTFKRGSDYYYLVKFGWWSSQYSIPLQLVGLDNSSHIAQIVHVDLLFIRWWAKFMQIP
jgi:hypothetical protein